MEEENPTFRPARRGGYDSGQVDIAFVEIANRIKASEQSRSSAEKSLERLTRELAEARSALKRANSKPSFSDLGAAFEQTLRVAEEQAAKMLKEAAAESQAVREGARAEADEVVRAARLGAETTKLRSEAEGEGLRATSERRATEMLTHAEARLLEARTMVEGAERAAAAIKAEVERQASDLRARVHQESEDAKTELATLRQISEREQIRVEREIKEARGEAERLRLELHDEAVLQIQQRNLDANRVLTESADRAALLSRESEHSLGEARAGSAEIMRLARERAADLISRARVRAETLSTRSNEHIAALHADSESRILQLEDQRRAIEEFALELTALASADAMVTLDETGSQRTDSN
jgi:cell division septum initiation protein DivIVA